MSGTKSLLAGRFGDAFKRFESTGSKEERSNAPRTPSPLADNGAERSFVLTPIAGSEATDDRSEKGDFEGERVLTAEQRRNEEKRQLEEEEARVERAAREYRERLARGGPPPRSIGGVTRASTIQNKVKSLLDENARPVAHRTAEGYGKYTDRGADEQVRVYEEGDRGREIRPATSGAIGSRRDGVVGVPPPQMKPIVAKKPVVLAQATHSAPTTRPGSAKPSAPPKPTHLHTGGSGKAPPPIVPSPSSMPSSTNNFPPSNPYNGGPPPNPNPYAGAVNPNATPNARPPSPQKPNHLVGTPRTGGPEVALEMTPQEKEDYMRDFHRRYPSLRGLEMVETVVGQGAPDGQRGGGVV
jgi:AP2-associated kinase